VPAARASCRAAPCRFAPGAPPAASCTALKRAAPHVQNWAKAVEDADKCISIKPDWGKGYGRKGAALHGMGDLEGAHKAYTEGLKIEPGAPPHARSAASRFVRPCVSAAGGHLPGTAHSTWTGVCGMACRLPTTDDVHKTMPHCAHAPTSSRPERHPPRASVGDAHSWSGQV